MLDRQAVNMVCEGCAGPHNGREEGVNMSGRDSLMPILMKVRAFWEARILMTAAELDIFSFLSDTPKTVAEVSKHLSSQYRGTEALLNVLAALDLLVKQEGKYRTKAGLERFLSGSTPETVLPMIRHMAHLWERWGKLTEIVLKGKEEESIEALERDEEGVKAFIGAMHTIGRGMAESVVSRLDLSGHENMIDVGGGSGVYTIAVLKLVPRMRATIFDLPSVIELARQKLAEEDLLGRVTLVKGNFYKDALPDGHDLALVSAIIHQNSPEQNVELFKKCFDSLLPGGMVVIRDFVMSEDHTQPADGAVFAINMLVNTSGGSTYSFEDIRRDVEAAGFADATLLHHAEMDSLVTARKPG
jgi:predicted O-methyltransferase YrrM